MILSFDTQLQVSLRALREVVGPALKDGEKQAAEQLHLAIATLDFMRQRLPYARRYFRLELEGYIAQGLEVAALVRADQAALGDALAAAAAAGAAELGRPEAEVEDYILIIRKLRENISLAIAGAAGKPYERDLDRLIIRGQEKLVLGERAWCAPLGFEIKPEELPSLDRFLGFES